MITQTDLLLAADTERIIAGELEQVFSGMDAEGLHLMGAFEQHLVNLQDSVQAATDALIRPEDQLDENAQRIIRNHISAILWHSLQPVHSTLFSGRELDSFAVAGTLQRALGAENETAFVALSDRLIDTCTPVRMCEETFEVPAVIDETLRALIADKLETGLPPRIAEDPAYLEQSRTLVGQVLEASCTTLVKAVAHSVTIPL